jgi:hypothetical protein
VFPHAIVPASALNVAILLPCITKQHAVTTSAGLHKGSHHALGILQHELVAKRERLSGHQRNVVAAD